MFGPPLAIALKIVEEPEVIVRLPGVTVTCGERQLTVTVTALLSSWPQEFVTRTQYVVVACGLTEMLAVVALNSGLLVFPLGLVYHWYVSVAVPDATTLSCAELPNVMVEPVG